MADELDPTERLIIESGAFTQPSWTDYLLDLLPDPVIDMFTSPTLEGTGAFYEPPPIDTSGRVISGVEKLYDDLEPIRNLAEYTDYGDYKAIVQGLWNADSTQFKLGVGGALGGPLVGAGTLGGIRKITSPPAPTVARAMAKRTVEPVVEAATRKMADESAAVLKMTGSDIGIETPSPKSGKYLRGRLDQPTSGEDISSLVARAEAREPIPLNPEYDTVENMAEVAEKVDEMVYIDPTPVEHGGGRYNPITERQAAAGKGEVGKLGNVKMARYNPAYPGGRQTIDIPGCGRAEYATVNDIPVGPCYGGSCYAESQAKAYGKTVIQNAARSHLQQSDPLLQKITQTVRAEGLPAAQAKYPDYEIKDYLEKVTAIEKPKTQGARVPQKFDINLKHTKGKDIRIGVDTDGSAYLSNPQIMDEIMKLDPHTLTVYSSGYHVPPTPHPLSGRTMLNVTVSGWHPFPETVKRLQWAKQARDNGWNVVLRQVTADPAAWADSGVDVARYNRINNLIAESDFFVMEQPLHVGTKHGKPMNYPACCAGGNCAKCRVSEGLGKEFRDFWGIEEGAQTKLMPDQPSYIEEVDQRDYEMLQEAFSTK